MSRKSEIKNRRRVNLQMQEARKRRVRLDALWREYADIVSMDHEDREPEQNHRATELESIFKAEGVWSEAFLRAYL